MPGPLSALLVTVMVERLPQTVTEAGEPPKVAERSPAEQDEQPAPVWAEASLRSDADLSALARELEARACESQAPA